MPERLRGQSAAEFGLIAPVLIILAVIVVDLGRFVAAYANVANSAREAAYFGSRSIAGSASDDAIRGVAAGEGSGSRIRADATHVTIAYPSPNLIEVRVRTPFQPLAPISALTGDEGVWISARAVFPVPLPTATSLAIEPSTPPAPTATPTSVDTPTPGQTPAETLTPSPTAAETLAPSPTATETPTPGPTPVETRTQGPAPVETPTPGPSPTQSPSPTPTTAPTGAP